MYRPIMLAAAIVAAAQPALAQEVGLEPGEAAIVHVEGGAPPERGTAEWTPFDVAVARHLAGMTPPEAPVPDPSPLPGGLPAPAPIREGVVRLRFLSIAGQHSLLIVENGHDRGLVYRARLTEGGRTRPTDVCLVAPMQRGFEHWPHPIERIEIAGLHLVAWRPGDPQPCR